MRSADPPIPLADLRDEENQVTVGANPYLEKMNASDIDGDGDDDADDGEDDEHRNQDDGRSDLRKCFTNPGHD